MYHHTRTTREEKNSEREQHAGTRESEPSLMHIPHMHRTTRQKHVEARERKNNGERGRKSHEQREAERKQKAWSRAQGRELMARAMTIVISTAIQIAIVLSPSVVLRR